MWLGNCINSLSITAKADGDTIDLDEANYDKNTRDGMTIFGEVILLCQLMSRAREVSTRMMSCHEASCRATCSPHLSKQAKTAREGYDSGSSNIS